MRDCIPVGLDPLVQDPEIVVRLRVVGFQPHSLLEHLDGLVKPPRLLADAPQEVVRHRGIGLVLQDAQRQLFHEGIFPHLERVARADQDFRGGHGLHLYIREGRALISALNSLCCRGSEVSYAATAK